MIHELEKSTRVGYRKTKGIGYFWLYFFILQTDFSNRIYSFCLLYTSDAADDTPCVDLGGRRIIKKKK